jgi:hypothetical protein
LVVLTLFAGPSHHPWTAGHLGRRSNPPNCSSRTVLGWSPLPSLHTRSPLDPSALDWHWWLEVSAGLWDRGAEVKVDRVEPPSPPRRPPRGSSGSRSLHPPTTGRACPPAESSLALSRSQDWAIPCLPLFPLVYFDSGQCRDRVEPHPYSPLARRWVARAPKRKQQSPIA